MRDEPPSLELPAESHTADRLQAVSNMPVATQVVNGA